jgi:hypothetical protein
VCPGATGRQERITPKFVFIKEDQTQAAHAGVLDMVTTPPAELPSLISNAAALVSKPTVGGVNGPTKVTWAAFHRTPPNRAKTAHTPGEGVEAVARETHSEYDTSPPVFTTKCVHPNPPSTSDSLLGLAGMATVESRRTLCFWWISARIPESAPPTQSLVS